jgi:glycosyltransferase involved in cell wall biosynthesis
MGLTEFSAFASWMLQARTNFMCEEASAYEWIWFHDVFNLAACLDLIKPTQRIILQSHCPQLPSEEESEKKLLSIEDLNWVRRAEKLAFTSAHIFIFPNESSRGLYEPLLRQSADVRYLMSGCQPSKQRYALPLDPHFIYYLYIGRRIPVKGYDIVINSFVNAYQVDSRIRLILVGAGDVVAHPGVIDFGFTTEPASLMAACDYMLSVNRQSYFDRSVMEALSLGTPLIITCTGGHFEFKSIDSEGIIAVTEASVERLVDAILANRKKRIENTSGVESNRRIYEERFTDSAYRSRLDCLLEQLSIERGDASIQVGHVGNS